MKKIIPRDILMGWGNSLRKQMGSLPDDISKQAKKKELICRNCKMFSLKGGIIPYFHCNEAAAARPVVVLENSTYGAKIDTAISGCGCPINKKVLSKSECPRGYFKNWDVTPDTLVGVELKLDVEPLIYGTQLSKIKKPTKKQQKAIDAYNFLANG